VIMKLQMNKRTRVLTMLVFSIAGLSIGASIAKAYVFITATLGRYTEDAMSILTGIGLWNLIEVQVGIIAACGPTLRAILSKLLPIEAATISLLSLLGVSKLGSTKSDTLPSFVRRTKGDSDEKLRVSSNGPSTTSTVTTVEHEEGHEMVVPIRVTSKPGNEPV